MTLDRAIERLQFCYPQVYYACHTRHDRARSTESHLSARDSAILVHLDPAASRTLTDLARHMHLSRSTLSEAVTRLETLGYVAKGGHPSRDRRHVGLVLTAKGVSAVRATSVLEPKRLARVLSRLTRSDRAAVIDALERLARACRDASLARDAGRRRC